MSPSHSGVPDARSGAPAVRRTAAVALFVTTTLLLAGCGSSRPEARGDWSDGARPSVVNSAEDCDLDDLQAGDADCDSDYYREAFGHLGVKSKANFQDRYGFVDDSDSKRKPKKQRDRKQGT